MAVRQLKLLLGLPHLLPKCQLPASARGKSHILTHCFSGPIRSLFSAGVASICFIPPPSAL